MVRMLCYVGRICHTVEGHTIHMVAKYKLQDLVLHILQVCRGGAGTEGNYFEGL